MKKIDHVCRVRYLNNASLSKIERDNILLYVRSKLKKMMRNETQNDKLKIRISLNI